MKRLITRVTVGMGALTLLAVAGIFTPFWNAVAQIIRIVRG